MEYFEPAADSVRLTGANFVAIRTMYQRAWLLLSFQIFLSAFHSDLISCFYFRLYSSLGSCRSSESELPTRIHPVFYAAFPLAQPPTAPQPPIKYQVCTVLQVYQPLILIQSVRLSYIFKLAAWTGNGGRANPSAVSHLYMRNTILIPHCSTSVQS